MIPLINKNQAQEILEDKLRDLHIPFISIEGKEYPEETVFVIYISEEYLMEAIKYGNELDLELKKREFNGFVTIRKSEIKDDARVNLQPIKDFKDPRVIDLVNLMSARSRTSENQPSLYYVPDAAANIAKVQTSRHNIIFGRRGAGKTALMLEAKRQLDEKGYLTLWMNLQTYRSESSQSIFLWICSNICDLILSILKYDKNQSLYSMSLEIKNQIDEVKKIPEPSIVLINSFIPKIQSLIKRFTVSISKRMYIFLDDFHYIKRK